MVIHNIERVAADFVLNGADGLGWLRCQACPYWLDLIFHFYVSYPEPYVQLKQNSSGLNKRYAYKRTDCDAIGRDDGKDAEVEQDDALPDAVGDELEAEAEGDHVLVARDGEEVPPHVRGGGGEAHGDALEHGVEGEG